MTRDEFESLIDRLVSGEADDGNSFRDYMSVFNAAKKEYAEFAGEEFDENSFLDALIFATAVASERLAYAAIARAINVNAESLRSAVGDHLDYSADSPMTCAELTARSAP